MKLYLDNCCFNRPFDDQSQLRIRLESEAKLNIQEEIRAGKFRLAWSYILDYENSKNPYQERKIRISGWRKYAFQYIDESRELLEIANSLNQIGLQKIDTLHVACAIHSGCDYFLTTDDKVLKRQSQISGIYVTDPFAFIKEVLS
jgi:hypothetical protein